MPSAVENLQRLASDVEEQDPDVSVVDLTGVEATVGFPALLQPLQRVLVAVAKSRVVHTLRLRRNPHLGDCVLKELLSVIRGNSTLVELDLASTGFSEDGLSKIVDVLTNNRSIRSLNLMGNKVNDNVAKDIGSMLLHNHALEKLLLNNNNIGPSGAGFIFFGMGRHHHLLVLGMAYNVIGDQGARAAADVLTENPTLQSLFLAGNRISDSGVFLLCTALSANSNLRSLDLRSNQITDGGVRRLLEVLEERSFEEIQVAGNQVSRALCDHFNAVVTGAAGSTPEIAERPNSSPAKSTAGPSGDFASQRSPGRGNHQSQGSPLSLKGMTVQELKQEVERLRAEMVDMERRHREELSLEQRRHLDEEKRLQREFESEIDLLKRDLSFNQQRFREELERNHAGSPSSGSPSPIPSLPLQDLPSGSPTTRAAPLSMQSPRRASILDVSAPLRRNLLGRTASGRSLQAMASSSGRDLLKTASGSNSFFGSPRSVGSAGDLNAVSELGLSELRGTVIEVTATFGEQKALLQIRKDASAEEVLHAAREHFGEEVNLLDMKRLQNGSILLEVE